MIEECSTWERCFRDNILGVTDETSWMGIINLFSATTKEDALVNENQQAIRRQTANATNFCRLSRWIQEDPLVYQYRWRHAPSIITRGDAELFGVSSPRFAIRVYLPDGRSFVNFRRSQALQNNVGSYIVPAHGTISSNGNSAKTISYKHKHGADDTAHPFEFPNIIGDCILRLPNRFRNDYIVLEEDFTLEMGEEEDNAHSPDSRYVGTPYVQSALGTGGCLHAVSFIASMLLKEHISVIHSLPEIAQLAIRQEFDKHLIIRDATLLEIANYFTKHLKLSARVQRFATPNPQHTPFIRQRYQKILRAYLVAKMPVICQVDNAKLHHYKEDSPGVPPPIYPYNGHSDIYANPQEIESQAHAVIAVGYGKKNSNVSDSFLIQDPKHLPFLEASAEQLLCAMFSPRGNVRQQATVLPISPPDVVMPLFDTVSTIEYQQEEHLGIHTIFEKLCPTGQSPKLPTLPPHQFTNPPVLPNGDRNPGGERFLAQADKVESVLTGEGCSPTMAAQLQSALLARFQILRDKNQGDIENDRWIWVQHFPEAVLIWDAETPPCTLFDSQRIDQYYIMAITGNGSRFSLLHNDTFPRNPTPGNVGRHGGGNNDSPPLPDPIKDIAIISSFTSKGYLESLRILNNAPLGAGYKDVGIELYAFMESDIEHLRPCLKNCAGFTGNTAVDFMAYIEDSPNESDKTIQTIADQIKRDMNGRLVRSLATFIPDIMRDDDNNIYNRGKSALIFACKLLARLNPDSIKILEVVAGGTGQGIWEGLDDSNERREVLVSPKLQVGGMPRFCKDAGLLRYIHSYDIRIVVEAEPGELFFLNSSRRLQDLANNFNRHGIAGHAGFNLDIAHWMAIASNESDNGDALFRLAEPPGAVIHTHVADGFCHLADLPLGLLGGTTHNATIRRWVNLIKKLYAIDRDYDNVNPEWRRCSRFVSVELECAVSTNRVKMAIDQARTFFS